MERRCNVKVYTHCCTSSTFMQQYVVVQGRRSFVQLTPTNPMLKLCVYQSTAKLQLARSREMYKGYVICFSRQNSRVFHVLQHIQQIQQAYQYQSLEGFLGDLELTAVWRSYVGCRQDQYSSGTHWFFRVLQSSTANPGQRYFFFFLFTSQYKKHTQKQTNYARWVSPIRVYKH